jgi:hypothetical protein
MTRTGSTGRRCATNSTAQSSTGSSLVEVGYYPRSLPIKYKCCQIAQSVHKPQCRHPDTAPAKHAPLGYPFMLTVVHNGYRCGSCCCLPGSSLELHSFLGLYVLNCDPLEHFMAAARGWHLPQYGQSESKPRLGAPSACRCTTALGHELQSAASRQLSANNLCAEPPCASCAGSRCQCSLFTTDNGMLHQMC